MKWTFLLFCSLVFVFLRENQVSCETTKWYNDEAKRELRNAMNRKFIKKKAKNIILFVGDGMGVSTVTASRILKGNLVSVNQGVEGWLSFDQFPHVGYSKTWTNNRMVSGSAGAGSAMQCGVKPQERTICVQPHVAYQNCAAYNPGSSDDGVSALTYAIRAGKRAGIVTTTRVTHATPADAYANSPARDWESDANQASLTAAEKAKCKDIATQLINKDGLHVILGGGRREFMPETTADPETAGKMGKRKDGKNLINEWLAKKPTGEAKYVWNLNQLNAVDTSKTNYLMGLFENSHMQYEAERNTLAEPSIEEMVKKAIKVLKNDKGYFLLVEGGRIDHAHHAGWANMAMLDTLAFDRAVKAAIAETSDDDTLLIVTADHSHVFTIGGYTSRSVDIRDFSDYQFPRDTNGPGTAQDGIKYTTILYGDGPGAPTVNQTRTNINSDTTATLRGIKYKIPAAIKKREETHGGEDVPIYARGPWAHLFHTTHEEHYVAHVIRYAACLGEYANEVHCSELKTTTAAPTTKGGIQQQVSILMIFIMSILSMLV